MSNGSDHPHTVERLPDPKTFNPLKDNFPQRTDIPEILEFKLDVIMVQLAKLNVGVVGVRLAILLLLMFLAAILAALLAILAALTQIVAGIAQIIAVLLALGALMITLALLLGRRIVRRAERLYF